MKFIVEFEMPAHVCFHCPLSNGSDECNLLDNDYEDDDEQVLDCPLKIVEG